MYTYEVPTAVNKEAMKTGDLSDLRSQQAN